MTTTALYPLRRVEIWFQDEGRFGQKGRVAHRWWVCGERPLGLCDRRFKSTYIFAAVCPATGANFALVLPKANTKAMNRFLEDFAKSRPADVQVLLVMDQAGWHGVKDLTMPENITPVFLPPYSPELTQSSAYGCTCANAISLTACSTITTPSSRPVARHGTLSPITRIACAH
jgi:hypothetical protein